MHASVQQDPSGPIQTHGGESSSSASCTSPTEASKKQHDCAKKKAKLAETKSTSGQPQSASGPLPKTYSISNPIGTVEKFTFNELNGSFLNGAFKAPQFKSRNQKKDIPTAAQNEGMNPVEMVVRAQSGQPMVACWRFGAKPTLPNKTQKRIDRNNRNSLQRVQVEAESLMQAHIPLPELAPLPKATPSQKRAPPTGPEQASDPNVISKRLALLQTGSAAAAELVPVIPYSPDEKGKKRRRRQEIKFTVVHPSGAVPTTTSALRPETESEDSHEQQQQTGGADHQTPAEDLVSLSAELLLELTRGSQERAPAVEESRPENVTAPADLGGSVPNTPLRIRRESSPGFLDDILGVDLDADLPRGFSEGFAPAMARPGTPPASSSPIGLLSPLSPRSPLRQDSSQNFGDQLMPLADINQFLDTIKPTDLHAESKAPAVPSQDAAVVSGIVKLAADEHDKGEPTKHKHKRHHHSCHKHRRHGSGPVVDL